MLFTDLILISSAFNLVFLEKKLIATILACSEVKNSLPPVPFFGAAFVRFVLCY